MSSSKFVTSEDGTKIWADAAGDPSKPSVVFIPGPSSSTLIRRSRAYKESPLDTTPVIHSEGFADTGVKLRYDVRGQGLSDQPLDPSAWTSNKFAEYFKAVVEAYGLKKPFIAAWRNTRGHYDLPQPRLLFRYYLLRFNALSKLEHGDYEPVVGRLFPHVLSPDLPDLCSTARDFVEAFAFYPDKIHPGTRLTWIGAYASQHPGAMMNYITRTQDEDALKAAAGKVPVLTLLGKGDRFILPDRVEKLFKETFADVEVQIWPEVGHIPFFEEPGKTRDAMLTFVKRVTKA